MVLVKSGRGRVCIPLAVALSILCSGLNRALGSDVCTTFSAHAALPAQTRALEQGSGPASLAFHLEGPEAQISYQTVKQLELAHRASVGPRGEPLLSIVIPAYREAARLPRSIAIIKAFFDRFPLDVQIKIVTENSPDGTYESALVAAGNDARFSVLRNLDKNGEPIQGGKGSAVRFGMAQAQGKYRLFMDADLSTSLTEVLNFLAEAASAPGLETAPAVMIGSRSTEAREGPSGRSELRRAMSGAMRTAARWAGLPDLHDTQAGFKMFGPRAHGLFAMQKENGFAFDVELLLLASRLGLGVKQMPIRWVDAPGSTVDPIRDSLRAFLSLMQMRSRVRAQTSEPRAVREWFHEYPAF